MDDIDSLPPIERMVDLNEARVFRIRGEIAISSPVVAGYWRNPIPVYNDADEVIGYASVMEEMWHLLADAVIIYSTPERLSLQADDRCYLSVHSTFDGTLKALLLTRRKPGHEIAPVEVIP